MTTLAQVSTLVRLNATQAPPASVAPEGQCNASFGGCHGSVTWHSAEIHVFASMCQPTKACVVGVCVCVGALGRVCLGVLVCVCVC